VIRFARLLVDADQLGGCQHTVISLFETPWDWDDEHRMWCEAGRPHSASTRPAFEALCRRFDAENADDHAGEYASPLRWQTWSATRAQCSTKT
jgi:hypothetical protein